MNKENTFNKLVIGFIILAIIAVIVLFILMPKEKTIKTYKNGEIVYYDVLKGKTCTDYHEDNSLTGYNGIEDKKTTENQNSCLKFYAFNDNREDEVLNLMLDHNTTTAVSWYHDKENTYGPIEILDEVKKETQAWIGTEELEDYTLSQTNGANYTIPYHTDGYKARIITANEIAEITGNKNFDENTSDYNNWFYFDTNTTLEKETCKEGNTTECDYSWLYDRTHMECEKYGCANNADNEMNAFGYWTATWVYDSGIAWGIDYSGKLGVGCSVYGGNLGFRPVIEVLKTNL